jgi:A/G-specific adenine glycosylase
VPADSVVSEHGHCVDANGYRRALVEWGHGHYRAWSWRADQDPYRVLIAELMLHRTQAKQVEPVYKTFFQRYPDVATLSRADCPELKVFLYPLGLSWRVGLIVEMARILMTDSGGEIPREREKLLELPGVSWYVASAVRCFAWDLPDAIVDTNTVRISSRLFGLTAKDSSRRNPLYRALIAKLLDVEQPRAYNYALLDLAALVCTKALPPRCESCPIRAHCVTGMPWSAAECCI